MNKRRCRVMPRVGQLWLMRPRAPLNSNAESSSSVGEFYLVIGEVSPDEFKIQWCSPMMQHQCHSTYFICQWTENDVLISSGQ